VLPVQGNYDDAFDLCMQACGEFGWYNRNTAINPFTVEGKKTVALEIALSMAPNVPDVVIVPTGDGVIVAAVAKGFADLAKAGLVERVPRLIAVQPEGSAAIVYALRDGSESVTAVAGASSVADSLVVERPRNAILALQRIRESGGGGVAVDDQSILESIPFLARHTGVFAEPAAAASLAGLRAALDDGLVSRDERIVLLVTGSGLKDVPAASRAIERLASIPPNIGAVERRLSGLS
jgi:threonine synthase